MKNACFLIAAVLFVLDNPSPASATPILFDWAFNINGVIYESCAGDALPESFDDSGFDWDSGLGVLKIVFETVRTEDFHVVAFFDHEVDQDTATYYYEYGSANGIESPGQSWEIDEPGYRHGDIYSNVLSGILDNANSITEGIEDDVSMSLGWNFSLSERSSASVDFYVTQDPSFLSNHSGFYLAQIDAISLEALYFYSTLDIQECVPEPAPVAEPATMLLFALGSVGFLITKNIM